MIPRDQEIGNLPPNASLSQAILRPTNININPRPYFKYVNMGISPPIIKYMDLRPKMANILDEKTINGSLVIAKIAGTESTAKIISVNSTTMRAKNNGVTSHFPESDLTKNLEP
jgi:hypothetical protein